MEGNLADRSSLDRALEGAYGVFSMQNFWEHGFAGEVRQGKNLADAGHAADVRHFVYSSVGSADRRTGISHFDSKYEIEEYIRELKLPYTILRPVTFMQWESDRDEILGGRLRDVLGPETSAQYIDTRDIGFFAAEAFDDPEEWLGVEIDIAGDELTMVELAAVFSRVVGRPVEYVRMPWDEYESLVEPELTEMSRWFEADGYDVDIGRLRSLYPDLISVEEHLRLAGWDQ